MKLVQHLSINTTAPPAPQTIHAPTSVRSDPRCEGNNRYKMIYTLNSTSFLNRKNFNKVKYTIKLSLYNLFFNKLWLTYDFATVFIPTFYIITALDNIAGRITVFVYIEADRSLLPIKVRLGELGVDISVVVSRIWLTDAIEF